MQVIEAQQDKRPNRHVPYRDSKLTFLLQDSLGGNAKTMVIANVSPSVACEHETRSTLQFAHGMKDVRNRAKVNTDTVGDTTALRAEVERLAAELVRVQARRPTALSVLCACAARGGAERARVQDGVTAESARERDELKSRLDSTMAALREAEERLENAREERKQLRYRLERLDEKLDAKDRCAPRTRILLLFAFCCGQCLGV